MLSEALALRARGFNFSNLSWKSCPRLRSETKVMGCFNVNIEAGSLKHLLQRSSTPKIVSKNSLLPVLRQLHMDQETAYHSLGS